MRTKGGPVTKNRRRRGIKLAKGYFGHKSIGFRVSKQQVIKGGRYAFRDRKQVKRDFRKLGIARINAACRQHDITYSRLIDGLTKAQVGINRKMLSELAIHEPETFKNIVDMAKHALGKQATDK